MSRKRCKGCNRRLHWTVKSGWCRQCFNARFKSCSACGENFRKRKKPARGRSYCRKCMHAMDCIAAVPREPQQDQPNRKLIILTMRVRAKLGLPLFDPHSRNGKAPS